MVRPRPSRGRTARLERPLPTFATWNVNSIRTRLGHVIGWLESNRPDVLCLQELKATDEQFPLEAVREAGYEAAVAGQKAYNGVAILSRLPLSGVEAGFFGDPDPAQARAIAATAGDVRVLNLYVPNGSEVGSAKYAYKLQWLDAFRAFLAGRHQPSERVLVVGDFNIAPEDRDVHDPAAWLGQIHCSEPEREALRELTSWGLADLLRRHDPRSGVYSWWDYRAASFARNLGLRIDLMLATAPLAERCTDCRVDREPRRLPQPSDHAPVLATFE
jgi:exodeoxyribonuclease-3